MEGWLGTRGRVEQQQARQVRPTTGQKVTLVQYLKAVRWSSSPSDGIGSLWQHQPSLRAPAKGEQQRFWKLHRHWNYYPKNRPGATHLNRRRPAKVKDFKGPRVPYHDRQNFHNTEKSPLVPRTKKITAWMRKDKDSQHRMNEMLELSDKDVKINIIKNASTMTNSLVIEL